MPPPLKLLYLGFAFPPGVAGLYPEAQPAGHLIETNMVHSLRTWFDIRSVGISWIEVERVPPGDPSPGLPHELNLLEKKPEVLYRWVSLRRLKHQYKEWVRSGWTPDVLLMCNFSPVYNGFIRWLKPQPGAPRVVLYLADSMNLRQGYPLLRRVRHWFKPLKWPDSQMVCYVDACAAVSASTEPFFAARKLPWFWLPNGCDAKRAVRDSNGIPTEGPIHFGYFGILAKHGGVPALLRVYTCRERQSLLHICGYGKRKDEVAEMCARHPRLRFYGPRSPDECLQFAQSCDVLVNPRPIVQGNENNISSKVFEYALSGRAILTTRISGVDLVLGERAFYFDEKDFDRSLDKALDVVALIPREELNRRGREIQERMLAKYSWEKQGEKLAAFLKTVARSQ
jgi:glycosyltransferase involved in cell wall biosynthesis